MCVHCTINIWHTRNKSQIVLKVFTFAREGQTENGIAKHSEMLKCKCIRWYVACNIMWHYYISVAVNRKPKSWLCLTLVTSLWAFIIININLKVVHCFCVLLQHSSSEQGPWRNSFGIIISQSTQRQPHRRTIKVDLNIFDNVCGISLTLHDRFWF